MQHGMILIKKILIGIADRISLVTAQISNKAQQSLRFLHVEAIGAIDAEAFMERIDVPVFSNNDNQKMLAAIKECISLAKGCEPTNEEGC